MDTDQRIWNKYFHKYAERFQIKCRKYQTVQEYTHCDRANLCTLSEIRVLSHQFGQSLGNMKMPTTQKKKWIEEWRAPDTLNKCVTTDKVITTTCQAWGRDKNIVPARKQLELSLHWPPYFSRRVQIQFIASPSCHVHHVTDSSFCF